MSSYFSTAKQGVAMAKTFMIKRGDNGSPNLDPVMCKKISQGEEVKVRLGPGVDIGNVEAFLSLQNPTKKISRRVLGPEKFKLQIQ